MKIKTHTWNTGRLYASNGQVITVAWDDSMTPEDPYCDEANELAVVAFCDRTRGIDGVMKVLRGSLVSTSMLRAAVMSNYDSDRHQPWALDDNGTDLLDVANRRWWARHYEVKQENGQWLYCLSCFDRLEVKWQYGPYDLEQCIQQAVSRFGRNPMVITV